MKNLTVFFFKDCLVSYAKMKYFPLWITCCTTVMNSHVEGRDEVKSLFPVFQTPQNLGVKSWPLLEGFKKASSD